jgi:hypothetical protein
MPNAWCDRLLDSHSLAILSAAGVALVAFPGADLVKSARAEPPPIVAPALSKGPEARLTGRPASDPAAEPGPAKSEAASEPQRAPAKPARDRPRATERHFEGCLATYSETACRRELDAATERYARVKAQGAQRILSRAALAPFVFDDHPQWMRRIESLAADGVALKRVRTGAGHEWVFGITREGVLGVSFEERRVE